MTALATEIPSPTLHDRILDAAVACVARWGVAKTTLDDVARQAGCSRATVYRTFPGGKDGLLDRAGRRELTRVFAELGEQVDAAASLEDALVAIVGGASDAIARHEALQYLLTHEPEVIAPYVSFDGLDPLLAWASQFGRRHLRRFVAHESAAAELGEWLARIVVAYGCDPADEVDLADPVTARRFVRTYLLPGLQAGQRHPVPVPNTTEE